MHPSLLPPTLTLTRYPASRRALALGHASLPQRNVQVLQNWENESSEKARKMKQTIGSEGHRLSLDANGDEWKLIFKIQA